MENEHLIKIKQVKKNIKHKCHFYAFNNLRIKNEEVHKCDTCSLIFRSYPGSTSKAVICIICHKTHCGECSKRYSHNLIRKRNGYETSSSQGSQYIPKSNQSHNSQYTGNNSKYGQQYHNAYIPYKKGWNTYYIKEIRPEPEYQYIKYNKTD